jgi:hypothetical protein
VQKATNSKVRHLLRQTAIGATSLPIATAQAPKTYVENTMVVQEPDGNSLEIACTVYNRWSHCTSLPVDQSFEAWMGKRGLEIRYMDQHGKIRKQLYEILRHHGKEAS